MHPEFWHDLWRTGRVGFHQAQASKYLRLYWHLLEIDPTAGVLVPLCGKSLDLGWLHDQGHAVIGVELSDIALQHFCMESGIPARRRVMNDLNIYEAPRLSLIGGDFFSLRPRQLGEFAAVFDRAALISWNEELRPTYVKHLAELTPSGVKTLLVTLEFDQAQKQGPPFSVDADAVTRLYAPNYEIKEIARQDVLAQELRMRERGVSRLHEICYQLTRL